MTRTSDSNHSAAVIAFSRFFDLDPTTTMDRNHRPPEPPANPAPAEAPPPPATFAKAFWTRYVQKVGPRTEIIEVKSLSFSDGPAVEIEIPSESAGWTFISADQIDAFAEILKKALIVDPLAFSPTARRSATSPHNPTASPEA